MNKNNNDYQKLYDFEWDFTDTQKNVMEEKVRYLLALLPKDIHSILDVGCGNGFITNKFAEKYDVTGVDINPKNLFKLKTKTILAYSHEINLPDASFDLVFSSEMLEHLPDKDVLNKTAVNFQRITSKYILITVPNDENLLSGYVKCGNCGATFNSSFHNFSFNKNKLLALFPEMQLLHFDEIGTKTRTFKHTWLIYIRNNWANKWAIPTERVRCPECQNNTNFIRKRNIIGMICESINIIINRPRRKWIVMLLQKKQVK
jgi:SAM-dependent methyltransferase